jgi:hypothetical protein
MVHALQEIHRLLAPGGCLIDIQPATAPTSIEVHRPGEILLSLPVPDQTFEDIEQAGQAIRRVVNAGLFTVDQVMSFELRTYASTRAELRDYVAQESAFEACPSSELLALEDPAIAAQVDALVRAHPGEAKVARLNPARIYRLGPIQ